jgi:hypothetical protein
VLGLKHMPPPEPIAGFVKGDLVHQNMNTGCTDI